MSRRSSFALLFWACAALLLSAAAARAQGQHTLEGRVVAPGGGAPQSPVRVTLTYSGRRVHETFTDLSGRFSFSGLARGVYALTADGDGRTFETTTIQAEVSAFGSAPQVFTQNVQLLPKRADAAPAPAGTVSLEDLDPGVPRRARELYQKGIASAAEGKREPAVKSFGEAIAEHPPFYAANLALAEQLSLLRRYDEALAAYRRASELKPDRPEAYVGVGVTLVSQGRHEEGIALLKRIVELDDKLAAPYLSLGYAEMMVGRHREAERHLLRALELGRAPLARVYLANVYEQLGEPGKAAEQLRAYLKENPQTPNADSVRGAIEKLRRKRKD